MIGSDFLSWFGETSLAVSVLIALVLLARRPVARRFGAEAAYLLWLAPVLRLIMPTLSILPSSWRAAPTEVETGWAFAFDATNSDAIAQTATPFDWSAALFATWAIGAAIFIAVQLIAQRRFISSLLTGSAAPSREIIAEAAIIAAKNGVKRLPPIRVASKNVGPLVAGVFRPVIILPANFADNFSSGERQLAFAHEFSHIKRGDLATTLAALVFRAAEWPNPLAHFAFRAFRADQEAACDAAVIAGNKTYPNISYAYGAALVKSASQKFDAPAASLAMSNHLKERLMLLKSRKKSNAAMGRMIAASLIAIGVAASASYSYAAEKEKKVTSVNVIEADKGEAIEIDGVKDAKKIEIRTEDGVRTVKIWDKNGKLVSEKKSKAGDGEKTIKFTGKDGKEKVVVIGAAGGHPGWATELAGGEMEMEIMEGDHDGHAMRKMVFVNGDGEHQLIKGDCAAAGEAHAFAFSTDEDEGDGKRMVRKEIVCIDGEDGADPAKRAEALRKAIEHMETSAKREAEHRAAMIAKMKEELAKAEKEAKKN